MNRSLSRPLAMPLVAAIACWACGSNSAASAAESAPSFEVYGFAQGDYVQDFRRVDPKWNDSLRPTRIPTTAGEFGTDGQASLDARQTRFGMQGGLPVKGQDLYAKFEFDMWGVGTFEGETTIRLRHAYGKWGQWLAGQTHSLFMDVDVFPNVIDYWGPSGMVFLRNPQIRWTPIDGDLSFAVAIERPFSDIDPGRIRDLAPELGANIQGDQKIPDFTAQVRANRNWGHVQLAGILRRLGYETLGTTDNVPNGYRIGWGLDLTSSVKFGPLDKLHLAGVYGAGIASYMNDGGVDLAPDTSAGALDPKAVPLFGVEGYYDHFWSEELSTSLGYSRTQVSNTTFQNGNAFYHGDYASVNFLYSPSKSLLMGIELLWGQRTDKDGNSGSDVRSQISFKYSFSSKQAS